MKEHIPTLALVASLAMILIALVVLSLNLKGNEATPVLLGLAGAVTTVAGILGGFSQQSKTPAPPSPNEAPLPNETKTPKDLKTP